MLKLMFWKNKGYLNDGNNAQVLKSLKAQDA